MALEKAVITDTDRKVSVSVMFNPEEYAINKDNNFAQIAVPGLGSPLLQFVNGNLRTLEMELLVDTSEPHVANGRALNSSAQDVRDVTRQITGLLDINPATHAPPVLLFTWGMLGFRCVLTRANERFVLFRSDGVPLRARLQVTFSEFTNADFEAKEVKRETADYSKLHVVAQGETLSSIAAREYDNPQLWRPIAIRNRIDDPRALPLGLELLVPQLPFRDPDTGEMMQ
jgi:nucleoid-associated protein YgaU